VKIYGSFFAVYTLKYCQLAENDSTKYGYQLHNKWHCKFNQNTTFSKYLSLV